MNELIEVGSLAPPSIQNDHYHPGNSDYEQTINGVKKDIYELGQSMEPWKCEFARRYAGGESISAIAKSMKKAPETLSKAKNKDGPTIRLLSYWKALKTIESGPSKEIRRDFLWRMAIDNRNTKPKQAIDAISEINKMEDEQKGGIGGAIQIIINTNDLPKGPLDE